MTNSPQYLEILVACWHAGLCVVPMNSKLHPKEFSYILDHAGVKMCFVTENLIEGIRESLGTVDEFNRVICVNDDEYETLIKHAPINMVDVLATDPAWIFYTSGTTGRPKGATLTHQTLLAMTLRYYADIDELSPDDSYFHTAPMSHADGLYAIPHLIKASHHIVPESGGFDVEEVFDLLETFENATFMAAPTMLTRMTNHPKASSAKSENIKTIYYGGAPMYLEDTKRAIATFGPCLIQIFGQGESPNTGTSLSKDFHADYNHPKYEERLSSVGLPRTGVDVRIVDEDDNEVPTGTVGEIVLRSDVVMAGYWENPEATSRTIRNGWLHTGDVGFLDEDGFLTLKDRSKDMIISGGTNIYPREIEEVLLMDSRLEEVSVVGRPEPDWGEEVVAFVVLREGTSVTAEELEKLCLDNIARFKRPKEYFFVDQLPKSNYGKILKTELRKQFSKQ
jgi:acyl-CoA synthetase (AMP-forming)/AMP-acid ligase II